MHSTTSALDYIYAILSTILSISPSNLLSDLISSLLSSLVPTSSSYLLYPPWGVPGTAFSVCFFEFRCLMLFVCLSCLSGSHHVALRESSESFEIFRFSWSATLHSKKLENSRIIVACCLKERWLLRCCIAQRKVVRRNR